MFNWEKNKQGIVGVVIIVVLIVVSYFVWQSRDKEYGEDYTKNGKTDNAALEGKTNETPAPATTTPPGVPPAGVKLTYGDALKKYPNRIQISQCRLSSYLSATGTMTVTKGTSIMLDNRDNQARTIKIFGYSYKLGAYGFRIVTANSKGTYNVTCDGSGSLTVSVQ